MPTLPIDLQEDGPHRGWSALVGVDTATGAVVDSLDGSSNDGDETYVRLPRLIATAGFVSFLAFKGAESLVPASIFLGLVARKEGANGPGVRAGFIKGTTKGLSAVQPLATTYGLIPLTFSSNPVTGAAWAPGDLDGLYIYVEVQDQGVGQIRLTLLYGTLTYAHRIASRYAGRYREGGAR